MKLATKTLLACTAAAAFVGSAYAATVTQFSDYSDGNTALDTHTVSFDVVNTNSILVATVYVDASDPSLVSATFNGLGATATVSNGRMTSMIFINPSTASGLNFVFDPTVASAGAGAILYEVSGAKLDLSAITTVTGSSSIETTTTNELIVSFGGNNGNSVPTLNAGSIFVSKDVSNVGAMRGGGNLASASITAPGINAQNITWNLSADNPGRIAYAFEVVPEPSSLALMGLGGLLIARRRRG